MCITKKQNNGLKIYSGNMVYLNGFTLVEALIYTAIIAIVASSFISFGILILELRSKSVAIGEININAQSALNIISSKIKLAESVGFPTVGATSSILVLNMVDGSTTTMEIVDNILVIKEGGVQINITNNNILISNLEFVYIFSDGNSASVRIYFNIAYNSEMENYQKNIQTTVSLRR
ncbi:hypothetical protein A2331_03590 [Candidatus Falkowbacteria bacterium RIFOXYB2_FULL_34_18]|uniref:Prepilin-type N-terminal cleavage/methylation domain-containing protein n=1 Tax=Candidatus Falkowbacteria bacterium RIFOXYD2_FULL_34_120 TaxID=1798007 RepID=A0A1F5TTC4_9BACT|nr:MAG: hypothetical protein A2331_03590 [Candidatus Falkowbacteria bacterium RIFOXYB2_FULL_34_18]OGF30096.1 MAG: hypothetical protein A2500_04860 [Candidatus Falkowbacteria bacterium RIFOXYC12_FULL_34_55]OGF37570.1 MAG: hypothetical protein A2466_01985 [Candidatus Falkowbacteria bacterium RIFOXYC2_FULL_34_220]OGF39326.1 MAG: hypothetical protein A2515_02400 [Candidatus Falkowbacteria bacterium RIFOXYD12_FULL_34_57]OGF41831.1 MAG: hypothetical protein A2531_05385 [Candidatus Falkowbacteria bact